MSSIARTALALSAACCVIALGAGSAAAGDGGNVYKQKTPDGLKVKLITNKSGAVVRGAIKVTTKCGGRFDPFRARFDIHRPLDRSSRARFADKASDIEEDDRFRARYRYKIKGKRNGPHSLLGKFDLDVIFRKDGEKYTTCSVADVSFEARNDNRA